QYPATAPAVWCRWVSGAAVVRNKCRRGPAGGRREPPGSPRGVYPVCLQAAGVGGARAEAAQPADGGREVAVRAHRPGRDQPLRGRRLRARQRRRGVPEPDVPLPADRGPLRRVEAGQRPWLPGAHRPDVLRRARHREDHVHGPAGQARPGVQLPVHRDRPSRVVEAIRVARNILTQPAFDEFNAGELSPGPSVSTDEEILGWVARDAETALHPSCTAKLGTDAMSVTDPGSMRVHGCDGLRVVDASVMPYVTNGNIYAPVMMTAEKAADLILGNSPLPPEPVEFYRHANTTWWEPAPEI